MEAGEVSRKFEHLGALLFGNSFIRWFAMMGKRLDEGTSRPCASNFCVKIVDGG